MYKADVEAGLETRRARGCTSGCKAVEGCAGLYRDLYNAVQVGCTRLYKDHEVWDVEAGLETRLYKGVYKELYKAVQGCTSGLYKVVQGP